MSKIQTIKLSGEGRVVVVRKDGAGHKHWLNAGYKEVVEKRAEYTGPRPSDNKVLDTVTESAGASSKDDQVGVGGTVVSVDEKPKQRRGRGRKVVKPDENV